MNWNGAISTRTTIGMGTGVVLAAFLPGIVLWSSLPDPMVVHWDVAGEAGGTASKTMGAFGIPLVLVGLFGLFLVLPRIDPLGANIERFRGHYNGFILVTIGSLGALHAAMLAYNLGTEIAMDAIAIGIVGVILSYAGVLLTRAKPNWFVGIRTPWTLSSETVWERTHAIGGPLFVVSGVVLLVVAGVVAAVGGGTQAAYVILGVVLVAALVPVAYSFYCYERLGRPDDRP